MPRAAASRKPKPWWLRVLRAAAVAILLVWPGYVVAINVFLSTSLFDRVLGQDPETISIHYSRGWSLWFGRIHAENLSIRSSDSNVEWILRIDEVDFDVDFLALTKQTFEVSRARGHGISLRARQRLREAPASDDAEEVRFLPPVDGFPPWRMRPAGPPHPERWDDEQYHLWTVRLENVIAEDVREVWVDHGRFEGHARIEGRFFLHPIREVEVGPAHVDFGEGGRVTAGASLPVAERFAGTTEFTLHRFDPRDDSDLIHQFTMRTEIRARFADLATLPFFPETPRVHGVLEARRIGLRMNHGRILPGTRVDLGGAGVGVALAPDDDGREMTVGAEAVDLLADVDRDDSGPRLSTRVVVTNARVGHRPATELAVAPSVTVHADSRALDLGADPLGDVHAVVETTDARADDLSALAPFVELDHLSGHARASSRLEVWAGDKRAAWSGAAQAKVDARAGDKRVQGEVGFDGAVEELRWDGLSIRGARADVTLEGATLRLAGVEGGDVFVRGSAAAHATVASWRAGGPSFPIRVALDARSLAAGRGGRAMARVASIHADVASPAFRPADPLARLEVAARVRGVRIDDPDVVNAFLPGSEALFLANESEAEASLRVAFADRIARGRLDASARRIGVRLPAALVRSDADLALAVDRVDLDRRTAAIGDSRLVLRDLRAELVAREDRAPGREHTPPSPDVRAARIEIAGRARDLALDAPKLDAVDARVALDNVDLPDARVLGKLLPEGGALRVVGGAARADGVVTLSTTNEAASGRISVAIDDGKVAVEDTSLEGDFRVVAEVRDYDRAARTLDLSGSRISARRVVTSKDPSWHGDLVLDDAKVRLDHGPELETAVTMRAKNARPVFALFLDSLPGFAVKLAEMPNLRLRARLRLAPETFIVSGIEAAGGDVKVRGAYATIDDKPQGAVVVAKGPISVGLELEEKGVSPKFFGLDPWLRGRTAPIEQKAKKP